MKRSLTSTRCCLTRIHAVAPGKVCVIGYSHSRPAVLTVVLVHREGGAGYWGANGRESNNSDRRRYERGE